MTNIKRQYTILNLLVSDHEGKGCKLCYLCNHWLGPPFTFHSKDCPVPALMKKFEERETELKHETKICIQKGI